MISAESMKELLLKVHTWKTDGEKGLRVNMGKIKILGYITWMCWRNLVIKKYPCGFLFRQELIMQLCGGCKGWVHKKCSLKESNEKAMNRNWSNQKANPALKTKMGNNQNLTKMAKGPTIWYSGGGGGGGAWVIFPKKKSVSGFARKK